jgi:outer membrane protein OmpA-like peptidoglycan-associated protein/tetratricopeptide (TPR) repeat protein
MKNALVILLLFFVNLSIWAQEKDVAFVKANFPDKENELKSALRDIEDGDYYYNGGYGNMELALGFYNQANRFNPNNALLNYKIGLCYLEVKPVSDAIKHFYIAQELNPKVSEDFNYSLARAYHLNLDFDKAIELYEKYKRSLKPDKLREMSDEIDKKISECRSGRELIKEPIRVEIENMGGGVNSTYPDYGPIINADESVLFFTSRRKGTIGGDKDNRDFEYYEDIYITRDKGGYWSPPSNGGTNINTYGHDAIIGISPDGNSLLLYRDRDGGDIYIAKLKGEEWSRPKSIGSPINSKYMENSASFSYDGRGLYFVSDRPGGYGGKDIYFSRIDDKGKWSEPINLGAAINTKYDEIGVFMLPDGKTLYFSSKGHQTMGGYDIFKTTFDNGKWSEPKNLGYPINSADNDVFFSISANGRHGYYSSVRAEGMGGQDLYLINFYGPEKHPVFNNEDNMLAAREEANLEVYMEKFEEIQTTKLTLVKGQVTDALTGLPLEANIDLVDNESGELIATFESNSASGKYIVSLPSGRNYGIAVRAEDYLFHSENFNISDDEAFREVELNIALKKVEVGSEITLNNIFFDYKKSELTKASVAELNTLVKLLNQYPTLKIEISGHTDNVGDEEYNQKLSVERAKAVVDYLISQGISSGRLSYVGYGFSRPLTDNSSEEGRRMNRRSEFKIISK